MAIRCRKCDTAYSKSHISSISLGSREKDKSYSVGNYICPECNQLNLILNGECIYPLLCNHKIAPQEVKSQSHDLAASYEEASIVLNLSPKASAALSRRCLQTILREKAGVKQSDLFKEISEVVNGGNLPSDLGKQLDNVRHLGNFAAHPNKDVAGLIIDITAEEAQYSLDVVGELFDHYYVRPARIAASTAQIKQKLACKVK